MSEGEFSAGGADERGRSGWKPSEADGGRPTVSPSASVSSAASTRPLEWDSGADVGYLLQNEERQLADAIKKLGIGLGGKGRESARVRPQEPHDRVSLVGGGQKGQKLTVDSLVEEEGAGPLMESTPKVLGAKGAEGGSRVTLAKTASSSSLATVVSKDGQSAEDKRGADLISDLTKGLHLVKSLIAEAKGDKEKQSKLLAHVVKQLKTVEEGRQKPRRARKPPPEGCSTSSTPSSHLSDVVQQLKSSFRSQKQKLGASGDSSGSLESAEVEDACQRLLSSMSSPEEDLVVAWANSQERLLRFPPDPDLDRALDLADPEFATFLQKYIDRECRRQACWRSDLLNLMSKRAEMVRQKRVEAQGGDSSSVSSSVRSEKVAPVSHLFPLTLNPAALKPPRKTEPRAKIFQHTVNPSKASAGDKVPATLEEFLSGPNKLTLLKPNLQVDKVKRKERDADLPLQELLRKRRPTFVKRAEQRRRWLALLGERRLQRGGQRRQGLKDQLQRYSGTLPLDLAPLPPPPLAEKRLFTQHELRHNTERLCRNLEEIKRKEEEDKRQQELKMNRVMAQIFKRKLQKKVLNHKVDLSNSVSVITSQD